LGFRFRFQVESFGLRASGFGFRVSSFGFRVSGFEYRLQAVGLSGGGGNRLLFWVFGYQILISGVGVRGKGLGNVHRLRGGLVFKAHRLLYHSTQGLRVIKKKEQLTGGGGRRLGVSSFCPLGSP